MSEIPGDLKFLKSHEWARVDDNGRVTVGISDHAQGLLGDLVYVELPNVGDRVEATFGGQLDGLRPQLPPVVGSSGCPRDGFGDGMHQLPRFQPALGVAPVDGPRVEGHQPPRGVEHVAGHDQGRVGGEGVDHRGVRVRQQDHVGLVDAAPAGDRAAVEHLAVLEQAGVDDRLGESHVVLDAAHVGEAQVDEFDLVVLDQLFDVFEGHGGLRAG